MFAINFSCAVLKFENYMSVEREKLHPIKQATSLFMVLSGELYG